MSSDKIGNLEYTNDLGPKFSTFEFRVHPLIEISVLEKEGPIPYLPSSQQRNPIKFAFPSTKWEQTASIQAHYGP